ncbi:MAG: hypothetical protein LBT08_10310, partial [Synergistaceae bacterium]|nr:hypothetical protein [Synergistaceae bacterium]
DDPLICAPVRPIDGYARLYAIDMTTGGAVLWETADGTKTKSVKLDGIKITSLSSATVGKQTSVFVTYDNLSGAFNPKATPVGPQIQEVKDITTLFEIPNLPHDAVGITLQPGQTIINYWLEK